jgi:transcriptional regulator with XRE-family HTH domain
MTQKELSIKAGMCSTTNISAIERGSCKRKLGVTTARKLAKAFNVHPAIILFPNLYFWEDTPLPLKASRRQSKNTNKRK